MLEESHPKHDWFQLFSEPGDFGFSGTARYRTWCIGSHKELSCCRSDPFEIYDAIKDHFKENCQCQVHDYLIATNAEVSLQAMDAATELGLTHFVPGRDSMSILLNHREAKTVAQLNLDYECRFGIPARSAQNLIYGLADNADYHSWSAVSGKIPTYRFSQHKARYWLPSLNRWLTPRERLVSMGWPVCPAMAEGMNVPAIGASDRIRAEELAKVIGNSMHLQTAGILQLLALACFGPT